MNFSFSSRKIWNLDVSISSRIMRFVFKISLSLLEIGENCRFLDYFLQKFSFSSRTRKQISTFLFSLLEIRDMDSIFLFLFSISLFGISSMPDSNINTYTNNPTIYTSTAQWALPILMIMQSHEMVPKLHWVSFDFSSGQLVPLIVPPLTITMLMRASFNLISSGLHCHVLYIALRD